MKRKSRIAVATAALLGGMLVGGLATMPQAEAHGFVRFGFGFPVFAPRPLPPPPPPPVAFYRPPPPPVIIERRVSYIVPPPRPNYYFAPAVYRYRHHVTRHVRHVAHRSCSCQCCR